MHFPDDQWHLNGYKKNMGILMAGESIDGLLLAGSVVSHSICNSRYKQ
jgi:hypothetical protein